MGLPQVTLFEDGILSLEASPSGPLNSEASGGETLSGSAVSAIPLNKRDFGQLLLLAAGTMTDANGTTNFTQQFAVNGQRGVEAVFAMDGADISDPEMGGATFTNFNVDAVEEIQSSSGWMPADLGRGAAGFTNIVTRSGDRHSITVPCSNSSATPPSMRATSSTVDPLPVRDEFHRYQQKRVWVHSRRTSLGSRPARYPQGKTQFFLEYQGFGRSWGPRK